MHMNTEERISELLSKADLFRVCKQTEQKRERERVSDAEKTACQKVLLYLSYTAQPVTTEVSSIIKDQPAFIL